MSGIAHSGVSVEISERKQWSSFALRSVRLYEVHLCPDYSSVIAVTNWQDIWWNDENINTSDVGSRKSKG